MGNQGFFALIDSGCKGGAGEPLLNQCWKYYRVLPIFLLEQRRTSKTRKILGRMDGLGSPWSCRDHLNNQMYCCREVSGHLGSYARYLVRCIQKSAIKSLKYINFLPTSTERISKLERIIRAALPPSCCPAPHTWLLVSPLTGPHYSADLLGDHVSVALSSFWVACARGFRADVPWTSEQVRDDADVLCRNGRCGSSFQDIGSHGSWESWKGSMLMMT